MSRSAKLNTFLITGLFLALGSVHATSPEEFVGPAPQAKTKPAAATAVAPAKSTGPKTASKSSASKTPVALDTAKIHATYLDGDFDQAIKALETHLKSKQPMSHADSIFAFKHLGVMYAATPATREKGRYYMYQLINIEPTARIMDMYASDMIYLIFRNVQEDYESKHGQLARSPAPAPATPDSVPAPAPAATAASKHSKTAYWVTGGAVLAAGTVGLLFVLLDDPKPKTHTIVVKE